MCLSGNPLWKRQHIFGCINSGIFIQKSRWVTLSSSYITYSLIDPSTFMVLIGPIIPPLGKTPNLLWCVTSVSNSSRLYSPRIVILKTGLRKPPIVTARDMNVSCPPTAESGHFLLLSLWLSRNIAVFYESLMQRGAFRVINLYANCSISLLLQTRVKHMDV